MNTVLNLKKNQIIQLQVICNSKGNFQLLKIDDNTYKMKVSALPIKGKANKEIINIFRKLKYKISIVRGEKSNNKTIKVEEVL